MAKQSTTLVLRRDGRTVSTLEMKPGCEDVFIGRSHACTLRTPEDDRSVSGRHVHVFWKGNSIFLEDAGSSNGIYIQGKRIAKPLKMKPGQPVSFGNFQLSLSEHIDSKKDKNAKKYHALELLNGDHAGKTVFIVPKGSGQPFSIGLDNANDLFLPDMLVSRRHALLEVKPNGECWIKDNDSRNGTFVNGEVLRGKERLLKDGDKISIAYYDMRFLDRSVSHTRAHLWIKFLTVLLTLSAMAMAYVIYVARPGGPQIEDYIRLARQSCEKEEFPAARAALKEAIMCRDVVKFRTEIDSIEENIGKWERVTALWRTACEALNEGRLGPAQRALDELNVSYGNAWTWNGTTAHEAKVQADVAREALQLQSDLSQLAIGGKNGTLDIDDRQFLAGRDALKAFLDKHPDVLSDEGAFPRIGQAMRSTLEQLNALWKGLSAVVAKMDSVNGAETDYAALNKELSEMANADKASLSVRRRAGALAALSADFAKASEFLRSEVAQISDLKMRTVAEGAEKFPLPSKDACWKYSKFLAAREALLAKHKQILADAEALDLMVSGLRTEGVTADGCGSTVQRFAQAEAWKKALDFDCFGRTPPLVRRTIPCGQYDEMLGIEYTYENIRALPDFYDGRTMHLLKIMPQCLSVRQAFEKATLLRKYIDEGSQGFNVGRMKALYDACGKVLQMRQVLIDLLKKVQGKRRQRLVAGFYADFFSPQPNEDARRLLAQEYRELQKEVAEMVEKYDSEINPERQIKLRKEILAIGLPGSPEVHAKWVQEYENVR